MSRQFATATLAVLNARVMGLVFLLGISGLNQTAFGSYILTASGSVNNTIRGNNTSEYASDPLVVVQHSFDGIPSGSLKVKGGNNISLMDSRAGTNFNARAGFGSLSVELTSFSQIKDTDTARSFNLDNFANAFAQFSDVATIQVPSLPAGVIMFAYAYFELSGTMDATVTSSGEDGNYATLRLSVDVSSSSNVILPRNGGGSVNGIYQINTEHIGDVKRGPASAIYLRMPMINGQNIALDFRLKAEVNGFLQTGYESKGALEGFADAHYENTLKWAGITKVTDAVTGEVIEDWTITSESGFDYTQPYVVPEPSAVWLLISAVGLGATRLRAAG